jgi:hypothetical protein
VQPKSEQKNDICTFIFLTWLWRMLNYEGLSPCHVQCIQHFEWMACNWWLQFCLWICMWNCAESFNLTDEAQFTCDGVNNMGNSHSWLEVNPHKVTEGSFQHQYLVNVRWCIIFNYFIRPYLLKGHIMAEMYTDLLQNELSVLLDILLVIQYMCVQRNGARWLSSSGRWRRVALIRTDVSEDRIASIFRVYDASKHRTKR